MPEHFKYSTKFLRKRGRSNVRIFKPVSDFLCMGKLLIVVAILFTISGCLPAQGGLVNQPAVSRSMQKVVKDPVYHDFNDILVPGDMKRLEDQSYVYPVESTKAGVIIIEGWLDRDFLIRFFHRNMAADKWTFMSPFENPRALMIFRKGERLCVVNIVEKYKTRAEIWVTTVNKVANPLNMNTSELFKKNEKSFKQQSLKKDVPETTEEPVPYEAEVTEPVQEPPQQQPTVFKKEEPYYMPKPQPGNNQPTLPMGDNMMEEWNPGDY
jgi:hypothetical protein